MIAIERIIDQQHLALGNVRPLYENTFPLQERRTWDDLLQILDESDMHFCIISIGNSFAGFIVYWLLDGWYYVEHIAIDAPQRDKALGTQVLQHIITLASGRLILETELPKNEDAKRRIKFYEKLRLKTLNVKYAQPPYRKGEAEYPMKLMSTVDNYPKDEILDLINTIRKKVYEKFY